MSVVTSFSVVIPAYQAAKTIGRAVSSALGQTLEPLEVIVCDDGSTDEILKELESFEGRIRLIRQSNMGLSAARNAACRMASADWIVLLDADDEWLPTRLERIHDSIMGDPSIDIVTTDAICRTPGRPDALWYDSHVFPDALDQPTSILDAGSIFAGAAIRRAALERAGWFTVGLPHDSEWEAWVRLLWSGSRAALVPEALAIYHAPDGPRLSARRAAHYRMGIAVYESLLGHHGAEIDALLERLLTRERRRLAVAEGVNAVRQGSRRGCLAAAMAPQMPLVMRPKFALAALLPRLASRLL